MTYAACLRVINPGLWTTIQDLGRAGLRQFGVPCAGAFDRGAHMLANALVGNDAAAATLEITQNGGVFECLHPVHVALAGAPLVPVIEPPSASSSSPRVPSAFTLQPGDRLFLRPPRSGFRTYLALRGGAQGPVVLGSRSQETPLRAGDLITAQASKGRGQHPHDELVKPFDSTSSGRASLRILQGPDAPLWPELYDATVSVRPDSNRVGIRLARSAPYETPPPTPDSSRLSAPIAPGAIQATASGLVIIGVAGGTMGGYPHVAHVVSADLDRVAQLRPGDEVAFLPVSLEEARELDIAQRLTRQSAALRIRAAVEVVDLASR